MTFQVNPDLLRLPSGQEQMVVHEARDEVHRLSRVAREIFELAAGSSSESIVEAMIARYPETDADEIRGDVDRTLEALVAKGLLNRSTKGKADESDRGGAEPA